MSNFIYTGNGTWTHFICHLEERLSLGSGPVEELRRQLDGVGSEGERVRLVVREWAAREDVSVGLFHDVTGKLGHGRRVQEILAQFEEAECGHRVVMLKQHRNSRVEEI